MAHQSPFRLELNIISASDLPPVSKMLRTFAVAYIHPDEKLTTKIDHQGHTNPTWNYKVVFHVDEKFLKQESAAVTIEIYNLAWLRDLPIGTTRLVINNLSPPLIRNPNFRRVALRLCRPSGHLQGTLNLGLQLVDNANLGENYCLYSLRNVEPQIEGREEKTHGNDSEKDSVKDSEKEEDSNSPGQDTNSGPESTPRIIESVGATPDSRYTNRIPSIGATSYGSRFSVMKPLPSEVADDLKKGYHSAEWAEYGSSIFENWTENGDSQSEMDLVRKQEHEQWLTEDLIPLTTEKKHDCNQWLTDQDLIPLTTHKKKECNRHKKKGMFSCFGSANGFQFSIICGSNELKNKMKIKNRNLNKQNVHMRTVADEDLRKFYI